MRKKLNRKFRQWSGRSGWGIILTFIIGKYCTNGCEWLFERMQYAKKSFRSFFMLFFCASLVSQFSFYVSWRLQIRHFRAEGDGPIRLIIAHWYAPGAVLVYSFLDISKKKFSFLLANSSGKKKFLGEKSLREAITSLRLALLSIKTKWSGKYFISVREKALRPLICVFIRFKSEPKELLHPVAFLVNRIIPHPKWIAFQFFQSSHKKKQDSRSLNEKLCDNKSWGASWKLDRKLFEWLFSMLSQRGREIFSLVQLLRNKRKSNLLWWKSF